ncbi:autotransporter outer membrane beta-barrel domain-containing protein [Escherichia coli]|nr:autotransporter outer membrane beta-barrel domain-containing protein [Escherichia coli]
MSLSAYNSSSREGAPRLSMLAAIIGALFSNAYASTDPIDIDNSVQVKKEQIDIDTGSNTGSYGYAISITNSGKLTTEGTVTLSTEGDKANGVNISSNSALNSQGGIAITTKGKNASGISLDNNSSMTIANGMSVTTSGMNATGINVDKSTLTVEQGDINTSGVNASGVSILNGGQATLSKVNVTTSGYNARGIVSSGKNSNIVISDSTITTLGDKKPSQAWGARGVSAENNGYVSLTNTQIKTDGTGAWGVFASSGGLAELTDVNISTSGQNGYGLRADGNNASISVSKGLQATTSGTQAHAVTISNNGNINLGVNASLETSGEQAKAIQIVGGNGGLITGDSVSIKTTGTSAEGIYVTASSATDSAPDSSVELTGTSTISTSGEQSIGVWGHGKKTDISVEEIVINTDGIGSHGINAQNDATVNTGTARIITKGQKSYGVTANTGAKVTLGSASSLTTSGDYAHGIWGSDDYTVISGNNTSIHVSGNNADSVFVAQNAKIELTQENGVMISEKGYNFNAKGGVISATLDSSQIKNNGTFISSISNDAGVGGKVDVTVKNTSFNGDIRADSNSIANLSLENSNWTGTAYNGGIVNLAKNSIWNMVSDSDVAHLNNNGSIYLGSDAKNTLTINGDYTGENGYIYFSGVLGDDTSPIDKLVVKGNTEGKTFVSVNNVGGIGAQTLNGINIIQVDGQSNGDFVQVGRIAAGAYDYTLGRGQGDKNGNWYLTSGKQPENPTPNPDPDPEPNPTPTPNPDPVPNPTPTPGDNDLRPEAGSYTANIAAANTMFVTRLHERQGQMQYTDVITGELKTTSMWMRHEGGHNRWRDGSNQLKTQSNRYVMQLGGDIAQWGWNKTDRWHLGLMAGYGNDHNNTESVRTGYRSKGSVNGYSTGLYATWYANDETHNGAYLDSWAQYSWFDNYVKGDGLQSESWKSKGLTASLETGYTWKAGEFTGNQGGLNEWYVQPQAQVIWMGVKADEHRESNGTRVESTGDGNVRTRLGVKTWIKSHSRIDEGKSQEFSPFVEVNWLHNTRDFGTRMNGVTVHQDGARNIGEIKAGVDGQINSRLNLWGNVGVQVGDKGYNDTSAMLGVKYTF